MYYEVSLNINTHASKTRVWDGERESIETIPAWGQMTNDNLTIEAASEAGEGTCPIKSQRAPVTTARYFMWTNPDPRGHPVSPCAVQLRLSLLMGIPGPGLTWFLLFSPSPASNGTFGCGGPVSWHEAPVSRCLYRPGSWWILVSLASEKLIKTCGVSAHCRPGDQAGQTPGCFTCHQ